ncbi:MarR family transcriptional regulator [Halostella sp. JP-L12]|uniref:DUF6432 family protein n=1 Tax=Halostella TaxID=1843185 RepID=UPI000EF79CD3|nr:MULTISPECIES: DUF6432 family protein [Halostella]NHN48217.1 MarR family transcriptional regulator [Halostella sp. JP-L12]
MRAKREYRDRDSVEVSVLDALVDRSDEGMTVFEIRSHVEADIDDLEGALATLKDDGLITVEENGDRTVIKPDDSVVPDPGEPQDPDESILDRVRDRLPF